MLLISTYRCDVLLPLVATDEGRLLSTVAVVPCPAHLVKHLHTVLHPEGVAGVVFSVPVLTTRELEEW